MSREVIIQRIEKSDLIDAKKELMIDLVNSKKEDNFDKKVDRLYRQFSKSSTFKKHAEKMVVRDDEKLKICNMMLVMSVTLTLFFLKAVFLDVLSLILCILFKMFFPVQVDFSLIILLVDYYLCKKRFKGKAFEKLEG